MNKQEYIGKLKKLLEAPSELKGSDLDIFYNMAIKRAIHLAEYLDEKPNNDLSKIKETGFYHIKDKDNTPPHYQGSIQPIDLINAQELNFNLGNVVKYVCRAGKKEGENTLSDLEKAKDYIDFEIERVKKWQLFIY